MIKNVGPIRFDSNGTADLGPTICTQKADRFKSAPHLPKTYLSGGFLESMSGVLNLDFLEMLAIIHNAAPPWDRPV